MIFIFKRSVVVLDCFTSKAYVHEYAPIRRAAEFIPQWWRALPKPERKGGNLFPETNMRNCAGFTDLYAKGVMLPMWSDLAVRVNHNGSVDCQYADGQAGIDFHPSFQRGAFADESQAVHMKIRTPWLFKCKDDIAWHFSAPLYNQGTPTDYIVCPGAVNFKYLRATNVSVLVPNKQTRLFEITHGTPLAHIIPLSDKRVRVNNVMLTDEEYSKMAQNDTHFSFVGSYAKAKKLKQRCPVTGWGF